MFNIDLAFVASQFMLELLKLSEDNEYILVESFVPDKQQHNHIALTYKLITKNHYVRFTVARFGDGTWRLPSSLYYYTDIEKSEGYKIPFRLGGIYPPKYLPFTFGYAVIEDMLDASFKLVDNIVLDFKQALFTTPQKI